eukprot:gene15900-22034_t
MVPVGRSLGSQSAIEISSSLFDPRRHSAVALSISQRTPNSYGSRNNNMALKSYMVGPNAPDKVCGHLGARPETAPVDSKVSHGVKSLRKNSDAHPRFIDADGQWMKNRIPMLIAESPAQELCATATMKADITATYQGGAVRSVKPLSAVFSYNDISPVTTAEHVRDGPASDPIVTQRLNPALNSTTAEWSDNSLSPTSKMERSEFTQRAKTVGNTEARISSINDFWNRSNGAFNLKVQDLERSEEIARNAIAGTPNTKLVNGRWKFIPRPVDGDVLYTAKQYHNSTLAGDSDYTRIRASMPGIQQLRNRAGLSMKATVASTIPSSKLNQTSPYQVDQKGIHRITQTARLRPEFNT